MLTVSRASAGAGKTFLLTQTYIDMLFSAHRAKNAHRRILAVTFTKKATAEMKQRIVCELSKLARAEESDFAAGLQSRYSLTDEQLQADAQQILYDLLQDYGAFAVSTIDSFFQQVIRAFSRELGLSGKYNLELDTKAIQQMAVDDLFFSLSPTDDKATFDALLAIIEENLQNDQKWDPKNDILALSAELFKEALMLHKHTLFEYLQDTEAVEAYRKQQHITRQAYFNAYEQAAQGLRDYLTAHGLADTDFSYGKDVFSPAGYNQATIVEKMSKLQYPARFITFAEGGTILKTADKAKAAFQMHEVALRQLALPLYDCYKGQQAQAYQTATAILKKFSILTLLGEVSACIDAKNKELNRLAISDTNALLNDVVKANAESPFIYEKIGTRVRHFLIDEFQDTSAMQWTSFRPLIEEALATNQDNLVVGDVKQSIYRFRNSDYSLMLRGIKRDFPAAFPNNLGGNWRSTRSVVNFNNALFGALSEVLNTEMNALLKDRFASCKDVIQEVYKQHAQDPMLAIKAEKKHERVEEGFVQVQFTPCEKKDTWRKAVLQQLPSLIADIQQRGIALGRVACLVRNNKDALPIAETLIGAGHKVMSNEGLKLTASPAVMLVITYLKLLLNPADVILQYELNYFAAQLHIESAVWEQLKVAVTKHASQSLFDYVQTVIHTFQLHTHEANRPYLLALQDAVYDYQTKYTADLYSFLAWWDEYAANKALSMQQTEDAIQLVSIHKSKGLEYDVVIIPFCDWAKAADTNAYGNILWVRPLCAEGDTTVPPLLPVSFNTVLSQTAFAADYYKELLDLYLDNLNLTYVAFTRAKKELYIFAPAVGESKDKKKEKTSSNMGEALHLLLQANPCGMVRKEEDDATTYVLGEKRVYTPTDAQGDTLEDAQERHEENPWEMHLPLLSQLAETAGATESTESTGIAESTEPTKSTKTVSPLSLRLPSRDFFSQADDAAAFGTLMHQLLQQVYVRGDEEQVMAEMLRMGMLQQGQVALVCERMQQFWQLIADEGKDDWYDDACYTIFNEQDILLSNGKTERPDRILIHKESRHAIIIDYKFGHERKGYFTQVRDYMQDLKDMGYTTEGYLCYVSLKKILPVTL